MIDIANNPKSKMPIILELDSALFILSLSISIVPFSPSRLLRSFFTLD